MLPSPQEKERDPSVLRKYAEHKAKQQGRKVAKKLAKKGAKFAVKLAKFAAKKFVLLLGKVLAWLVGAVGLPVIGIALAVIVALIVISFAPGRCVLLAFSRSSLERHGCRGPSEASMGNGSTKKPGFRPS